jgi:hypothetical protein
MIPYSRRLQDVDIIILPFYEIFLKSFGSKNIYSFSTVRNNLVYEKIALNYITFFIFVGNAKFNKAIMYFTISNPRKHDIKEKQTVRIRLLF